MKKYLNLAIMIFLLLLNNLTYASNDDPVDEIFQDPNFNTYKDKSEIHRIWLDLYKDYYHLQGSKLSDLYEHLTRKKIVDFETILNLSGHNIFVSGPHKNGKLNLNTKNDFGHYNKDFLKWIGNNIFVAGDDLPFKKLTQLAYEVLLSRSARLYYASYIVMIKNVNFDMDNSIKEYNQKIETGKELNSYQYIGFLNNRINDSLKEKYNFGEYYDQAEPVTFWLRREIDGTANQFAMLLEKLFSIYDKDFLFDIKKNYNL